MAERATSARNHREDSIVGEHRARRKKMQDEARGIGRGQIIHKFMDHIVCIWSSTSKGSKIPRSFRESMCVRVGNQ